MSKLKCVSYNQLIILFVSTILGCVITNIWIRQSYDISVFDFTTYNDLGISKVGPVKIGNILLKRVEQMAVIILAIKVFRVERVLNLLVCILGYILGFFLTVQSYYLGVKGVIFVIFVLAPPFVCYYLSLQFVKYYIKASENKSRKFQYALCYVMFFALGVLFECNFFEKILTYFSQYMVTV